MLEAGQIVSHKYKLLRLLGDGGMGAVYEAEHLNLGTRFAIKVLHPDLARRAGIAERFLQEARIAAQIRSPHVVQVTDVDRTPEGTAYLVMELLQGETLSAVLERERRLAVATACEYTTQILQALEAAHALGAIHRDLKPDNVFVTFQGGRPVLKLIDFGIAKLKAAQGETKNLTVAGMLMGTPEYMAPEQAYSADKVDVRADLYAVGVMLYEMLAGEPPAMADDPRVLIAKVERGDVVPLVQAAPGIEPPLAGFVHRAMAPRPELRFASATEMRIALDEILTGKRPRTAKLPEAPTPLALPLAPPAEPTARAEGRTGTEMGVPLAGALASAPEVPAPTGLHLGPGFGAPPFAAPPPGYGPGTYEPSYPPSRRRGGSALVVALALIALLLGAGAVVAYVQGTQRSLPPPPAPTFARTPDPPARPAQTAEAPVPVAPVTPLTPGASTSPSPSPPPPVTAPKKTEPAPAAKPSQPSAPAPPPEPTPSTPAPTAPAPTVPAPTFVDAGDGQTSIVTPFGTFQFPGPRPPFYPADQPWPPTAPNLGPSP